MLQVDICILFVYSRYAEFHTSGNGVLYWYGGVDHTKLWYSDRFDWSYLLYPVGLHPTGTVLYEDIQEVRSHKLSYCIHCILLIVTL